MDDELNKIVDTYYEDAPIIDTNEDSLETYNEVEIRRTEYNDDWIRGQEGNSQSIRQASSIRSYDGVVQ